MIKKDNFMTEFEASLIVFTYIKEIDVSKKQIGVLNITDDYNIDSDSIQRIDDEKDKKTIIVKFLLLSIPGSVSLLSLIGITIGNTVKPLLLYITVVHNN